MTQLDQIKAIQEILLSDENDSQTQKVKEKKILFLFAESEKLSGGRKIKKYYFYPKVRG